MDSSVQRPRRFEPKIIPLGPASAGPFLLWHGRWIAVKGFAAVVGYSCLL